MILADKNTSEELVIVAKNDDHLSSMVDDKDFYAQIIRRNEEANQLMNLSNPELTKAGDNAAQNAEVLVTNDKDSESWINRRWRPAMGWMYMTVCIFDFILFPIAWSILQALAAGSVTTPWQPLTLQGAGLFHIAMGAVLGIAVYGRTKEKIEESVSNTSTQSNPLPKK